MISLDLGCGNNKQKNHLGLDIKRNSSADIIADLENLPIRDCCINKVYSRRVLQHVEDYLGGLKEIHRILKPGGDARIIVASLWGLLFYKSGFSQSSGKYSAFHLFTKRNLEKKLKQINFINIKITRIRSHRKIGYDFQIAAKKMD